MDVQRQPVFRAAAILEIVEPRAAAHRDPALAALLSAFVPGAGLLYAGTARAGATLLVAEAILYALGWWIVLLPLHLWQIAAAAGTAAVSGERGHDVFETRRRVHDSPAA